LTDEDECAGPAVAVGGELPGGAGEDCHVQVVAAGVHGRDLLAGEIGDAGLAGVGHAGLFEDGQAVEIGADEQGRTGPFFEDADDAVRRRISR